MVNNILCGWKNKSLGLLLLRLTLGSIFIVHGVQKFMDIESTIGFFSKIGIPSFFAYVVAFVETFGGLAVVLGIFTGLSGILLAIVMVVALITVKFNLGFFRYEIDLALLGSALAIIFTGPGHYSIHNKICKSCKVCVNCHTCTPESIVKM